MKYITGIISFGVECERDSTGKWNITKEDFLNEKNMELKESEDSPFKDYGIEKNKLVSYHEFCTYNVADHVRAYCDMLYEERFDELEGLFFDSINSMKCRHDIFMLVYGKLRNMACFPRVNKFMTSEFGNAWESYVDSVNRVADHISDNKMNLEQLQKVQGKLGKTVKVDLGYAKPIPTIPSVSLSGDSKTV